MQRKKERGKYQEWGYLILYREKCNQRKKRVIAIVRRKAKVEEKDSKQSGGIKKTKQVGAS
jgi:hypothetical protein